MDEVTEVLSQDKFEIVNQKLRAWRNTVYALQIDAQVAQYTSDDPMLRAAQEQMKRALKAVELLESKLRELNGSSAATSE